MANIIVSGFIATTDPVPAYGGVALSEETIKEMASSIRLGDSQMPVAHDGRRALNLCVLGAEIRRTDRGSLGVWLELEVEEEEWKRYGDLRAFSVGMIEHLVKPTGDSEPFIGIYADAAHFDEQLLAEVEAKLKSSFVVGVGRLYQFSELPPPNVIIEMTMVALQALPGNLLGAVLYDALKMLLKPKHAPRTVFRFRLKDKQRWVEGYLETDSEVVAREAVRSLPQLASAQAGDQAFEFDSKKKRWCGRLP